MTSNLGGTPSVRWLNEINDRNWYKTTCVYESESMDMIQHIIAAFMIRQVGDNRISLYIAIYSVNIVPVL